MLFKICTSIENWLAADPENVAVVHCLTGKGRTATVLACLLSWLGEGGGPPLQALQCVAAAKGVQAEALTIPSQRRYVQYFSNVLDGVRPRVSAVCNHYVCVTAVCLAVADCCHHV
jgi:hypothetical protein